MTMYERTEVIGIRATQIERGGQIFVKLPDNFSNDPIKMAEYELMQGKCPLSIKRYKDSKNVEIWSCNELIIPNNR